MTTTNELHAPVPLREYLDAGCDPHAGPQPVAHAVRRADPSVDEGRPVQGPDGIRLLWTRARR